MVVELQKSFNPSEHITKLPRYAKDEYGNSVKVEDDYLEVKWRLVWFRATYPQGTIETQEMCIDDREVSKDLTRWDKNLKKKVVYETVTARGYARIKAIVKTGEGGIGTGTKTETAIDFPDFVEKAETGAIGRALAALGYGTQFTGEDMEEGKRIVDSPVKEETAQKPQGPTPISNNSIHKQAPARKPLAEESRDPTIKAANDGLYRAALAAKQRVMQHKIIQNDEQWLALLDHLGIAEFKTGTDIGILNADIDQRIKQPIAS
jgi:hypothetical protein